jgi:hypothetical protein
MESQLCAFFVNNSLKDLIAKGSFMRAMAYRRTGMKISATIPKDFEWTRG